ncbi:MAG: alpha/beta fold hydrolase [Bacteroidota bacterium]
MAETSIDIICDDGFVLKGSLFLPASETSQSKVLVINSATAVGQGLYRNYARFMADHGFPVITYDYRGIALSRPKKLRGFEASFTLWGEKDVSAVLDYVQNKFPDKSILVLGHSIGGTLMGMTPKNEMVSALLTIGAQTAYYKDWGKGKNKLYVLWHGVFPVVTQLFGYFPGKRLKLLEDIPKGVVQQWHMRKRHPNMIYQLNEAGISVYYNRFEGKLLTYHIQDDPIGTATALKRIHDEFVNADTSWKPLSPQDIGVSEIGHFGFFKRKFRDTLWKESLAWFENA